MKKLILLIAFSIPVALYTQDKENCAEEFEFTSVQVYDNIIASLERSNEIKVCVATEDKLQITNEGGILRIRKEPGTNYDKQPRVHIYYTSISSVEGYAKADIDTRNLIQSDSLKILLMSGSRFYADCDVKYLNVKLSEGSLLKIDGYAVEQILEVTGKATFSGFELIGDKASVKASKWGTIKLNAEKEIEGSATSGGHITYKGTPRKDVKTSLGGKVVANE